MIRRQIPGPFFSRELCRKAHTVGTNLTGGAGILKTLNARFFLKKGSSLQNVKKRGLEERN